MKDKFSTLQNKIREKITDHKALAAHVSGMYILGEEHKKKVAKASTVDEIFRILTKYWSFLDFSNLKNIAKNLCYDCDTEIQIKNYKEDVEDFCEHRVSELPPGSLNNGTDMKGMDKLVITLDLQDALLSHVLDIKEAVANILQIPTSTLILHDIGKGSVVITLWIASSLGEKLLLESSGIQRQKEKFLEANVLSVKFKEITIFKGNAQC